MSARTSDVILERMMSLHPKVIDLVLDRVWRLLDALDHPETRLPPVIHIAGTNGKGSTQAMIRAGLEAAGMSVHAYTSPHLARFHERIRLAGKLIDEADLMEVLEECERANGGAPITYFEITTVAAMLAMSRVPADYTLLEVGLGGRLDATNVIDRPDLTIITPISIDHTQFLGDTIEAIAGEKAGIIKKDVPCIVGPQPDAALTVIEERAARLHAPLLAYGQHWHVWEERGRLIYQDERGLRDLPLPRLAGHHQILNAGAALAALRHLGFGDAALEAALTDVHWPARMQRLKEGPLTVAAPKAELYLDGGHNPAAGEALAEALDRLPQRETHLVCGMLNTKDVGGYLRPLARHTKGFHAVSIPDAEATLPADVTAAAARESGMAAETAPDVLTAVKRIAETAPEARILICGSLYLAGHILQTNG
ncbi:bifunctional folylpolyglutamate synthase/dihydrofolate synthase [Celeribacter indicus]|uniref:Dihydrofolate synthase/folylpolyglutamate synthase n=1 Tax=Celeribacter indicus TaxID=1208324 RepID=A0A0B5DQ49_9RHOB|nr:folylpolyglutamate synthase/dihydrofolate synthase family protein [Celeribacter indicus]AJE45254.1 bifunctional folylpolyglutamate synthase/ dihydrofolate synthase [Celeribacter indicus]SDX21488.1 dihydrofolate synthase / folylpolyglutamate synthase [Celeribacter indicus]